MIAVSYFAPITYFARTLQPKTPSHNIVVYNIYIQPFLIPPSCPFIVKRCHNPYPLELWIFTFREGRGSKPSSPLQDFSFPCIFILLLAHFIAIVRGEDRRPRSELQSLLPFSRRGTSYYRSSILLPLSSYISDRKILMRTSSPGVGVPLWHLFLWSFFFDGPVPPPSFSNRHDS